MKIILVQTDEELEACLDDISGSKTLFLDTEFMRERTYYPEFCLLQLYVGGENVYLIDPLSKKMDISPLLELLKNEAILKVFHAARQDLEIFFHDYNFIPSPLFDTQIAAHYLGYDDQVSFENMVRFTSGVKLDKTQQRTDWRKRPLSQKQISYAARDVFYLAPIFEKIHTDLQERSRLAWIEDDIQKLTSMETYQFHRDNVLKKVRNRFNDDISLSICAELMVWREKQAMSEDLSRQRVLSDDMIVTIATRKLKSKDDLRTLKAIKKYQIEKYGDLILETVQYGQDHAESFTLPRTVRPSATQEKLVAMINIYTKQASQDLDVIPRVLASSGEIQTYAVHGTASFLSGWKYDVYGQYVEKISHGEAMLKYHNGNITLSF
ncbi:MAG: ribonuclease D [Pseudomonadota bacterium]